MPDLSCSFRNTQQSGTHLCTVTLKKPCKAISAVLTKREPGERSESVCISYVIKKNICKLNTESIFTVHFRSESSNLYKSCCWAFGQLSVSTETNRKGGILIFKKLQGHSASTGLTATNKAK